jgi:hypothetical protein
VLTDVRYENEAEAVRSHGGQIWRVTRPGTAADGHSSETTVDAIRPNFYLRNDGSFEALYAQVDELLSATPLWRRKP